MTLTGNHSSDVCISLTDLIRIRAQARGFAFLPRQPMHSILAGKHGSRLRGRGLDFEEIRTYQPGDDIRTMDWRVTARLGSPHVRIYNEERDRPGILVVDQRATMFFGSVREMKSVTAARLAALGAWRILEQDDRVGAIVFGDTEIHEIRPRRSRRTVMQILHELVELNRRLSSPASTRTVTLNQALERACRLATHDCLVTIISDFIDADEETRRLLTRLSQHNDVLVAYVYDPMEARLPAAGRLVITGEEGQLELDSNDARLRERFTRDHEQRLAKARSFLLKRTVPVLPIHTRGDVAGQVRDLLGNARSARGRSR